MSPDDVIKILLRVLQATLVISLMLGTALVFEVLSTKTKLQNPVFSAWIVAEFLSTVILELIFVEIIYSFRYNLQAYGYLIFQSFKLFLWTFILVGTGILIEFEPGSNGQHSILWGPLVMLIVFLMPFVADFVFAFSIFRRTQDAPDSNETSPLLPDSL